MADLACDIVDIGSSALNCTENFSGIGSYLLVAFPEDLESDPEYDATKAEFTTASFTFASGKGFHKIKIKKQSGKVTSTLNGQGKGYSNVITAVVDQDMEAMSHNLRVMANRDIIAMAPDGKGKYYVAYDPVFRPTLEVSSDTGDTPDSDSGHTITITCNPSVYPLVKWAGTPTMASADSSE